MRWTASSEQSDLKALSPAVSASPEGGEVSILDILVLLARRKKFIVLSTVFCTTVIMVIGLLLPVSFTATSTFLPPQQASSGSSALLAQLGNLGSLAGLAGGASPLKSQNDLYIALMKSETVENAMVRRFDLIHEYHAKDWAAARKAFEQHTKVDGSGKDGMIHVSVDDHDAKRAAELANGYIDQYRQLSAHLAISEASQRRVFFEQQLKDAKDQLAQSEEALKETQQSTGMIQLDSQARALIESAGTLRAEIGAKEVQIASMKTYAGADNADLHEAEEQLATMRAQLAKLTGNGDDTAGLMLPKGVLPQAGLEYIRRERDLKYNQTIFEILARQFEAAKLDEAKEGALIQVVDAAYPPERKSFPHLSLFLLGGILLGLMGGCGWVLAGSAVAYLDSIPEHSVQLRALREAVSLRGKS
jgi:uncharacterized protein involved in exopolysaccharide biosynthesis